MSQPRIKHSSKKARAESARLHGRLKRGAIPTVAILQDKAGKILGVGTNYENAHKAAQAAGEVPAEFDIADYLVVS